MTLLDNHLEQISLSSAAIADLPFPPPKIFTNALLHTHDITALIRDTESHERVLFSSAPSEHDVAAPRRTTVHSDRNREESLLIGSGLVRRPRHGSAAAALLGGELGEQLQKEGSKDARDRGEVDVELLLKGAERLCGVYPIAGASERIFALRTRHGRLTSSISRFEARVSKQTGQLARMNKGKSYGEESDDFDGDLDDGEAIVSRASEGVQVSAEDFSTEEDEIQELEKKKRALEERVAGMERDLGGLLR